MDFNYIYRHKTLNSVLSDLVISFIMGKVPASDGFRRRFSAAVWAATSLSSSDEPSHKRKAFLFAALSKNIFPNDPKVDVFTYAIFLRTGNVPATRHLSFLLDDFSGVFPSALEIEFLKANNDSASMLCEGLSLTSFQSSVEQSLARDRTGLISAPTSAGKSFIVHEYVKYCLKKYDEFVCVFIVPTKALIAQFSSIYRSFRFDNDVAFEVYSSVPDGVKIESKKCVFCLTQERCIKLLSSEVRDRISFVFVDEIQKVEDAGRGALLEYVVNELQRYSPNSKMFFAGPYISNPEALAGSLGLKVDKPIGTENSPVSQMVMVVKAVRQSEVLDVALLTDDPDDEGVSFEYNVGKRLYSRWRSQERAITDAIGIFASNSPSIVYAPGPGRARNWAMSYASDQPVLEEPSMDLADLIDYVKESMHPACSLVYCLERGVAFHHGSLPDFIREEIEDLFSMRIFDVLFCTSTLLEGVNLPADKIFVVKPAKGDENLSIFEFRNLIGRAGRLKDHLNGVVYCIVPSATRGDDWIDEYKKFENYPVETFLDSSLMSHYDEILEAIYSDSVLKPIEDDNQIRSSLTILRSRFLIDRQSAEEFCDRKNLSENNKEELCAALRVFAKKMVIPKELAEKNPYVDPILQDKLFRLVSSDPGGWIVRRGVGFTEDFTRVFNRLDEIFSIVSECRPYSKLDYQGEIIISYAKAWLNGSPFHRIVKKALPKQYKMASVVPPKKVDDAVKMALEYVNRDVSFVTAKYFSVLAEILRYLVGDDAENYSFVIGLPVMLELGCRDPKQISLISACIPRGVALALAEIVPDVEDVVGWVTEHQYSDELSGLPRLYERLLKRVGVWK